MSQWQNCAVGHTQEVTIALIQQLVLKGIATDNYSVSLGDAGPCA